VKSIGQAGQQSRSTGRRQGREESSRRNPEARRRLPPCTHRAQAGRPGSQLLPQHPSRPSHATLHRDPRRPTAGWTHSKAQKVEGSERPHSSRPGKAPCQCWCTCRNTTPYPPTCIQQFSNPPLLSGRIQPRLHRTAGVDPPRWSRHRRPAGNPSKSELAPSMVRRAPLCDWRAGSSASAQRQHSPEPKQSVIQARLLAEDLRSNGRVSCCRQQGHESRRPSE